jgi:hypothetical protein
MCVSMSVHMCFLSLGFVVVNNFDLKLLGHSPREHEPAQFFHKRVKPHSARWTARQQLGDLAGDPRKKCAACRPRAMFRQRVNNESPASEAQTARQPGRKNFRRCNAGRTPLASCQMVNRPSTLSRPTLGVYKTPRSPCQSDQPCPAGQRILNPAGPRTVRCRLCALGRTRA